VFDNAASSLYKLATYRSHCGVDPTQVLPHWLAALPSKADVIEARVNHFTLLRLAEAMDPRVVGPNGENMPRIVAVFAGAIVEAFDEAIMAFDEEEVGDSYIHANNRVIFVCFCSFCLFVCLFLCLFVCLFVCFVSLFYVCGWCCCGGVSVR
jgi:hypothetical protein